MGDVPGGTSRPNRSPLSLKTSLDTNELILIKAMGNKPCAERYGAPRLGLEPRTLRLHETHLFPNGVDYLISPKKVGELGANWCNHLVSAPTYAKASAGNAYIIVAQAWLRVAIWLDYSCHLGFPEFTQFSSRYYYRALPISTGGRPACRQAGLPLSYRGMIFDIDINERLNYNMIAPTEK